MFFHLIVYLVTNYLKEIPQPQSFSFLTNHKKELILTNPIKYISKNNNIFHIFSKNEKTHGNWYYIHFLTNDLTLIQHIIIIRPEDKVMKNTYALFLMPNQIENIQNISLIKRIEPQDKFNDEGGKIEQVDHLLIYTSP